MTLSKCCEVCLRQDTKSNNGTLPSGNLSGSVGLPGRAANDEVENSPLLLITLGTNGSKASDLFQFFNSGQSFGQTEK
jgi:hypothetical protein